MKAFACAFGFLTRLPVPHLAYSERDVAGSAAFFGWVGAAISALLWLSWLAVEGLGPRVASALVLCVWVLVTGALHLDGLADSVDGLSGGRGDRERALAIMRDSRIGAHGAAALVLALVLKLVLLEDALARGDQAFLLAPIASRAACTMLLAWFPYARREGLGSAFAGRVGLGSICVSALSLLSALGLLWPSSPFVALAGIVAALAVGMLARIRLGGLTGDVHGAAIELSEIVVLLSSCVPA